MAPVDLTEQSRYKNRPDRKKRFFERPYQSERYAEQFAEMRVAKQKQKEERKKARAEKFAKMREARKKRKEEEKKARAEMREAKRRGSEKERKQAPQVDQDAPRAKLVKVEAAPKADEDPCAQAPKVDLMLEGISRDVSGDGLAEAASKVKSQLVVAEASSRHTERRLESADRVVQEKLGLLESATSKHVEGEEMKVWVNSPQGVQAEKEKYEAATRAELEYLINGEPREQAELTKHYANVKPLIDNLGLDESLKASVYTSLSKAPSLRTQVDNMLVLHLTECWHGKLAKLSEELIAVAQTKWENTESVRAEGELYRALVEQAAAHKQHVAAEVTREGLVAQLQAVQEALSSFKDGNSRALDMRRSVRVDHSRLGQAGA